MRNRVVYLVVALIVMVVVAGAGERILLEGSLVRVNDRIVTVSEFAERVRQELSQVPQTPTGEELRQFVEMLLQEIVNELVLMERATEKRVEVDEQMVDQAIANLREENNLQDDEAWEQALTSSGLTIDNLRERYRRTILLQRAVQGEVRPVEITEEELRQQYEEEKDRYLVPAKVELEQVFISVDDGGASSAQAEQIARGMVSRVRDGADLKAEATLAGAELQDLGEIPVDDCRADLIQALEGLDDGGVTEPLPVPGGFQVIRLVRRIPEGYQPFEEVMPELRRERSAESYESQTRGLVEKLRKEYLVEVHDEYLDQVFAQLGGIMTDEQRVWIKDLRAGSDLEEVYAVRAADVRQRRGGGPYLAATLGDRTGEVTALVWQNVDRFRGVLEPGNVVAIKGQVQRYNQQLQIVVRQAEAVPEASVDEELFLRSSSVDPALLWKRLIDTIEDIGDPVLRQLLLRVFSDPEVEECFRVAPAARSMHHAFRSGLLEHTVSVTETVRLLSGHYDLDTDLVTAGALLHDLGKIWELEIGASIEYTDDGRLIGHLPMETLFVEKKIGELEDFPATEDSGSPAGAYGGQSGLEDGRHARGDCRRRLGRRGLDAVLENPRAAHIPPAATHK